MMQELRLLFLPALVVLLLSCAGSGDDGWVELKPGSGTTREEIHLLGTVRHLEIEGGLFVIRNQEGTTYNPTNLPEAFRVDGMKVEAEARLRDDMMSLGMAGPLIDLVRIRKLAGPETRPVALSGSWLLEDLAGKGVLDDVPATLEFSGEGDVSGNASCNRFTGTVTVNGDAISFGPLASTRKMCPEAIMNQENRYLEALSQAERFEREGPFLYLYTASETHPLRFIGMEPGAGR